MSYGQGTFLALYIFVRSWSNTALTYITIPIFVTGIIKYGERTFVLRSSSSQYFKERLLSNPDPGPDFIKIQEESRRQPGQTSLLCCCFGDIERDSDIDDEFRKKPSAMVATTSTLPLESLEASTSSSAVPPAETSKRRHAPQQHQPQNLKQANVLPPETLKTGANYLQVAYFLFKRFRYLFADLILSYYEREDSYSKIETDQRKMPLNWYGTIRDEFRWSISDVEFDHSLLLWHIATDLCYYSEKNDDDHLDPNCGISKYLSDYTLHLLVFCPSMLPEGIAEIRYRDTLAECISFQKKKCFSTCAGQGNDPLIRVRLAGSCFK
ncbi:hypothetical protein EZV62_007243 [Acer yangbiense]|uniref:DUF4220 domain-containing protein n=1 Tax=Acer yangbiense TaxID=1000413 RepID=A0A5C7IA10_9ROSI|nr:hypothetical protein EZV62_007243 [Acer yangbiense]